MKAKFYPTRNCWRITVPARLTESGKQQARYFPTKELAEAEIRRIFHRGPLPKNNASPEELAMIRTASNELGGSLSQLLEAVRYYRLNVLSIEKQASLLELVEKFIQRQEHEKRAPRTIDDDRQRLNKFWGKLGNIDVRQLTEQSLRQYLEQYPPGTNRRSHYKAVRKFIRWAHQQGYLAVDLMARIQPMDRWGINNEIIDDIEDFRRLLFVTAGLEPIADADDPQAAEEDKVPTTKYLPLLPYYVLGGLAGMRRSEMLRDRASQQVIEWTDILWAKNLIRVRNEVAKKTRAEDRRRFIPLEPAAKEWLQLAGVKKSGPIVNMYQSTHTRLVAELLAKLEIELPENGLRNSYASYALTFRSLGAVAKNCGDLEATIKRFYVETLEPETGRAWFEIRPGADSKILPIRIEAA